MAFEAMILGSDSQNLDTPVPFTLSPLAIEDLTDEPVFALTPSGLAELATQPSTLTAEVMRFLARFTAARKAREEARGDALATAMQAEDQAALKLAWALERSVTGA